MVAAAAAVATCDVELLAGEDAHILAARCLQTGAIARGLGGGGREPQQYERKDGASAERRTHTDAKMQHWPASSEA